MDPIIVKMKKKLERINRIPHFFDFCHQFLFFVTTVCRCPSLHTQAKTRAQPQEIYGCRLKGFNTDCKFN